MNTKSYEEENKRLFAEWKCIAVDIPFIKDGVMNADVWFKNKVRPLFLFGESFGTDDNLREGETRKRAWRRIALWTKGIMNTGATYMEPFKPCNNDILDSDNKYLERIAAVNINKDSGNKKVIFEEICEYAKAGKKLLKRQIELCDPTVIICGGTGRALEIILDNQFRKYYNNNLFYNVNINGHSVIVIDYWRLSNTYPEVMNYYCLTEVYQRALRNNLIKNHNVHTAVT